MLIINFFAGPGAGKSLMAMETAGALKRRGLRAEPIPEAAKLAALRKDTVTLSDQLLIFASQNHWLEMCRRAGVQVAVVDSPLLLSLVYRPKPYYPSFDALVRSIDRSYPSLDYLIERAAHYRFDPIGRVHTEHEARDLDHRIRALLQEESRSFTPLSSHHDSVELIVRQVTATLRARSVMGESGDDARSAAPREAAFVPDASTPAVERPPRTATALAAGDPVHRRRFEPSPPTVSAAHGNATPYRSLRTPPVPRPV